MAELSQSAAEASSDVAPAETEGRVSKKGRWLVWARDIGIGLLVFMGVTAYQTMDLLGSGQEAPGFSTRDMNGQPRALADYQGKPTLMVFWAPWCGVCGVESSNISDVAEAVGDDANVISVVVGYEGLDSVREFMTEHEVDYPVLLGNSRITKEYAVNKFPTMYILDSEGRVQHTSVGFTTELGLRARLWAAR
mgnify:CR=1 FL=1